MSRHAGRQMADRPDQVIARRAETAPARDGASAAGPGREGQVPSSLALGELVQAGAEQYGAITDLQRSVGNRSTVGLLDVQTKLTVGAAEDAHEIEADAVARQVVERLRASPQESGTPAVTAAPGSVDDQEPLARHIQRRASIGAGGGDVDDATASTINSEMGGGRALDGTTRRSMESAFGADFGHVRVHTGETSTALNRQLQASAFTVGRDIFFRSGVPDTASDSGRELLAHELTHVVQQGGGAVSRTIRRRAVGAKYMHPGANPKIDRPDRSVMAQIAQDVTRQRREDEDEEEGVARRAQAKSKAQAVSGARSDAARRAAAKRKGAANTNYRGAIPGRALYAVKAAVMTLPDVAIKRMVPGGPNGVAGLDPDDYGFCETEDIGDADLKVAAVRDGDEWHAETTKISARYSKLIQLPDFGGTQCKEITGPGGGGPGETTVANSLEQLTCLLATEGEYYMLKAIDGHESVHEERLLPALRAVAAEMQERFAALTVPYSEDGTGGGYADKTTALTAIKALPAYAATVAGLRDLWDAKYVELIGGDHQGKAQKGEEKYSRPMVAKINAFRRKNKRKAVPVKYTWVPY